MPVEAPEYSQKLRRAEEALAQSEERFQLAARAARDVIWDWDLQADKRWWSAGFERLFGFAPEQMGGNGGAWVQRVHPHDKRAVAAGLQTALECGDPSWSCEYRFQRADSSYASVLDRGYILRDSAGRAVRMIGAMMDISLRKSAEEELRRLNRRLLETQEQERSRLASELHDGVSQLLSAAKFRLQMLEEKLASGPAALKQQAAKIREMLDQAREETRRISRRLRPSELDDLGLAAAIRSACDDFRERTGIELDLQVSNLPEAVAPELELALYRILQEALANVQQHARASRVCLRLAKESGAVSLVVRDNGRGFDLAAADRGEFHGLGLANIKERVRLLGGRVSLRASPKRGVELAVRIPLGPRRENAAA